MFWWWTSEPLRLWYEDAAARPDEAAARIADFLGVALDPAAAVAVPAVQKQSGAESRAWAELYARSRGHAEGTAAAG
ncbi:MAG: Stf0 family sulfotransferase [Allosphingosinicella sp.]